MSLKINISETADATIFDMSGRVSLGDAQSVSCGPLSGWPTIHPKLQ